MKYVRLAGVVACVLILATCSTPLVPVTWNEAQRAVLAAAMGSESYAANLTRTPRCVINLDMIADTSPVEYALPLTDVLLDFPTVGDFILVVAPELSHDLGLSFCTVASEFVPELPTYMLGADAALQNNPLLTDFLRGDHASFWARNIGGIFVTDTANLRQGAPYHTAEDTAELIDFPFMVNVIKVVAALTALEAGLTP